MTERLALRTELDELATLDLDVAVVAHEKHRNLNAAISAPSEETISSRLVGLTLRRLDLRLRLVLSHFAPPSFVSTTPDNLFHIKHSSST